MGADCGVHCCGEGVDTLLFVLVAFYEMLPSPLLGSAMISNCLFKVGLEALATP